MYLQLFVLSVVVVNNDYELLSKASNIRAEAGAKDATSLLMGLFMLQALALKLLDKNKAKNIPNLIICEWPELIRVIFR